MEIEVDCPGRGNKGEDDAGEPICTSDEIHTGKDLAGEPICKVKN